MRHSAQTIINSLKKMHVTYALIFVAAILLRAAKVFRVDFAPWWDGVGWGYADLWTSQAAALAYSASNAGLDFKTEGLLYVPLMGIFLKIFGFTPGINIWAWFLVLISAAIPVIAASTIHSLTGRLGGSIIVAILVTLDPVQEAFGLNGWSDSITFFAVSLSFLAFTRAVASPSKKRLIALGIAISLTALSHATWTWPAMCWALLTWPLLSLRHTWGGLDASNHSHLGKTRLAIPILSFVGSMLLVNFLIVSVGPSSSDNIFPVFSSDIDNQRALVTRLNPDVDWESWESTDTIRTFLFVVPPKFPSLMFDLIGQQITGVLHLSAWILCGLGAALIYIARNESGQHMSRWLLLALPLFAWVAWSPEARTNAAVPGLLLILAMAWIYVPTTRGLLIAIIPITALLAIFLPHNTHFRHSNAVLYVLILIFGLVIARAAANWQTNSSRYNYSDSDLLATSFRCAPTCFLLIFIAWTIVQAALGFSFRQTEDRYLHWLGSLMHKEDVLLTSGNVNPWHIASIIPAPVIYDVEHGGRLFVDGKATGWGPNLRTTLGPVQTNQELVSTLRQSGKIWVYRPGKPVTRPLVAFRQLTVTSPPEFYTLHAVDHFPDGNGRPAFMLGPPVHTGNTPPDLPSQTGRG